MKIVVKQTTNRVSTIKPPDTQSTQTEREILKDLFKVHIPDSKLIDDSGGRQGQQNLGLYRCTINKEDWNLANKLIKNQMSTKYL